MKKAFRTIIGKLMLVVCILSLLGNTKDAFAADKAVEKTPEEIYETCSKAVVEIYTLDSEDHNYIGTGFFVSKTLIFTNYHVIEAAVDIQIADYYGNIYTPSKIYGMDIENDMALIKVKESNPSYLKFETKVTPGQKVYSIGNPLGLAGYFCSGLVGVPKRTIDGKAYLQLSIPVGVGAGGGPVLNAYGKVLGVVTLSVPSAQCIGFALRAEDCKRFIDSISEDTRISLKTLYKQNKGKVKESNAYFMLETFSAESNSDDYKTGRSEISAEDAYKLASDCTATIYRFTDTGIGYGSGFFISEDCVLTNYHVIGNAAVADLIVEDYNGKQFEVKNRIDVGDGVDMVYLVLKDVSESHPFFIVNRNYVPKVGETVYVMGTPVGYDCTFSEGIVSMSKRSSDGILTLDSKYNGILEYINVTAPIATGSSGGPLINKYGEAIGVITKTIIDMDNSNLALMLKYML